MSDFINTEADLANYFHSDDKPLSSREFNDFWWSLTLEERLYYRNTSFEEIVNGG